MIFDVVILFRAFTEKPDTMGKKRKTGGRPFVKDDARINRTGPPNQPPKVDCPTPTRVREPRSIYNQISATKFGGGVPLGARLRPKPDVEVVEADSVSQNWIVDEQKLLEATNEALRLHDSSGNRHHTPVLQKLKTSRWGFGVSISFKCRFKNCRFSSPEYKLYDETSDGVPLQNVQVGVAMAKTELTPKTVDVLGAALNLATPARTTLQRSYSNSLLCSNELAEGAMAQNRSTVTSAVRLLGELTEGEIPSVDVATDGQYSNRSYHFPAGKSDSVSVPVVEHVTGFGLLVEHTNLSHRDGSLPANVHINSAETLAAQKNLEKSYQTKDNPLFYGTVTIDGDASVSKALETGRNCIGESRPLKRRGCHFHGVAAGT